MDFEEEKRNKSKRYKKVESLGGGGGGSVSLVVKHVERTLKRRSIKWQTEKW